jgi:UDP-N-acetyl-D-galactosamine dehydrogenase
MHTLDLNKVKISVVGMGYVGLPLAVAFGQKYKTVGFDINKKRIELLQNKIDHTNETSAKDLTKAKFLEYSSNPKSIEDSNVYIVTVPTPIDDLNIPDLNSIKEASKLISSVLKKDDLVIYESTVYPGLTEEICIPILEESNLILNKDFLCGYSPERINPGDQHHRLTNIVKVVSGSNAEALNIVDQLYSSIIDAGTYRAQTIKVAEAAKVIENTQRDLNIALVNELSIIFNKLDIDTSAVLDAASTKWNFNRYNPGLVGGHCIGVDPYYLTFKSKQLGYLPKIILSGRKVNNEMPAYICSKLIESMKRRKIRLKKSKVLILGFTFKENCPDIRNTKVIDLFLELKKHALNPDIFDPFVNSLEAKKNYGVKMLKTVQTNQYDAVILAVPHKEFIDKGLQYIKSLCSKESLFFDIKGAFSQEESQFRL